MTVTDALLAVSASAREEALAIAQATTRSNPDSALARLLADYLSSAGRDGVYDEPTAFEDFIDHGGNPSLYAAVVAALRDEYDAIDARGSGRSIGVLDIGCGDGRVTAATVPPRAALHLLEPAPRLLESAKHAVADRDGDVTTSPMTLTEMLSTHSGKWDVAQATFAMSAIAPADRRDALRELSRRVERLMIVEFDIPDFEDRSPAHAAYAAERYERGVTEYDDWPNVQSGFLMPVLVGQFDPDRPRHTCEQSADAWLDDLRATGWVASVTSIAPYWWADAVLLDARPARPPSETLRSAGPHT
mgnify:CR=1 FL=1